MKTPDENVLLIDSNRLSMVGYIDALTEARWKVAQRRNFEDCESYLESHSNSLRFVILGSPLLRRSDNDCWNLETDLAIVISHFVHLHQKWPDLLFVFLTPFRESELWNAITSNHLKRAKCLIFEKVATAPAFFAARISDFAEPAIDDVVMKQKPAVTRRVPAKSKKGKHSNA